MKISYLTSNPPLLALLLAIVLFFAGGLINPNFVNLNQATNIVRLAAFLGIIAAGQTLVIISGNEGIDLSVGGVVTLAAILVYRFSDGSNEMVLPALALALGAGAWIGMINGLGIILLNIPPLVMTLGMTGVIGGTILVVTQGELIGDTPPILARAISEPLIFGIPGVILIWGLLALVMWLILERTTYGKQLFAIGVNRTTARLSGVRVSHVVVATYALSGFLAAFAGFVLLGFTQTVFLNLGGPYLFPSIAAVVVGGTMLAGGKGSYFGTMSGALVLTLVESLLRAAGQEEAQQLMILGVILLVLLSLYGRQRNLRQ
jgi:ribose transport system permease protein